MKKEFEIIGYHLTFIVVINLWDQLKPRNLKIILWYYSRKYVCDKDIKLGKKTTKKGRISY